MSDYYWYAQIDSLRREQSNLQASLDDLTQREAAAHQMQQDAANVMTDDAKQAQLEGLAATRGVIEARLNDVNNDLAVKEALTTAMVEQGVLAPRPEQAPQAGADKAAEDAKIKEQMELEDVAGGRREAVELKSEVAQAANDAMAVVNSDSMGVADAIVPATILGVYAYQQGKEAVQAGVEAAGELGEKAMEQAGNVAAKFQEMAGPGDPQQAILGEMKDLKAESQAVEERRQEALQAVETQYANALPRDHIPSGEYMQTFDAAKAEARGQVNEHFDGVQNDIKNSMSSLSELASQQFQQRQDTYQQYEGNRASMGEGPAAKEWLKESAALDKQQHAALDGWRENESFMREMRDAPPPPPPPPPQPPTQSQGLTM